MGYLLALAPLLLPGFHPLLGQNQIIIEAESGELNGAVVDTMIAGYSGLGYVTDLDTIGDFVQVDFDIPFTGQYKLEINYICHSAPNSSTFLLVDQLLYSELKTNQTSDYQILNAGTLTFSTGKHSLRLQFVNARIEPDFFLLTPLNEVAPIPIGSGIQRVEAENGILLGTRVEFAIPGFSGDGYVSNFNMPDQDKLRLLIETNKADEYDIVIGYASPFGYKENYLSINEGPNLVIPFSASTNFTEVSAGKHQFKTGINTLEITHFWGFFDLDYIEFRKVVGLPPKAVSQGNILLDDRNADLVEMVRLDGSQSQDPDGQIASYQWQLNDSIIGLESIVDYTFPVGTHIVQLTVTDNDGNTDYTDFVIIISDLDNLRNHRIPIRNDQAQLFMSGMNIAWSSRNNYAKDLINFSPAIWTKIFDDIQAAGGNAARWWLHTNGAYSPEFNQDGRVSGINPRSIDIMQQVLDLALERGIMVSMCLWSFDMLQEQGQDLSLTRAILEDSLGTEAYIQNALIPIIQKLGDHPAVMTWEICNEPEGMTTEFGWSDQRTSMFHIQRFVNRCAGAIHRTVPTALVSNGAWSMRVASDTSGFTDFYRDDRLIVAGGDPDGTLDIIQVHYYDGQGPEASPFHYPASYWGITKPIIIGEFPSGGIQGYTIEECYQFAYKLGYAGAFGWSYSDEQFGGLAASVPGIQSLFTDYPEDIMVPDTTMVVYALDIASIEFVQIYPNPSFHELFIKLMDEEIIKAQYEIISMQGQMVGKGSLLKSEINSISVSSLSPGTYNLRIIGDRKWYNQVFVKL